MTTVTRRHCSRNENCGIARSTKIRISRRVQPRGGTSIIRIFSRIIITRHRRRRQIYSRNSLPDHSSLRGERDRRRLTISERSIIPSLSIMNKKKARYCMYLDSTQITSLFRSVIYIYDYDFRVS